MRMRIEVIWYISLYLCIENRRSKWVESSSLNGEKSSIREFVDLSHFWLVNLFTREKFGIFFTFGRWCSNTSKKSENGRKDRITFESALVFLLFLLFVRLALGVLNQSWRKDLSRLFSPISTIFIDVYIDNLQPIPLDYHNCAEAVVRACDVIFVFWTLFR